MDGEEIYLNDIDGIEFIEEDTDSQISDSLPISTEDSDTNDCLQPDSHMVAITENPSIQTYNKETLVVNLSSLITSQNKTLICSESDLSLTADESESDTSRNVFTSNYYYECNDCKLQFSEQSELGWHNQVVHGKGGECQVVAVSANHKTTAAVNNTFISRKKTNDKTAVYSNPKSGLASELPQLAALLHQSSTDKYDKRQNGCSQSSFSEAKIQTKPTRKRDRSADNTESSHICKYCKLSFSQKSDLDQHQNILHGNSKFFSEITDVVQNPPVRETNTNNVATNQNGNVSRPSNLGSELLDSLQSLFVQSNFKLNRNSTFNTTATAGFKNKPDCASHHYKSSCVKMSDLDWNSKSQPLVFVGLRTDASDTLCERVTQNDLIHKKSESSTVVEKNLARSNFSSSIVRSACTASKSKKNKSFVAKQDLDCHNKVSHRRVETNTFTTEKRSRLFCKLCDYHTHRKNCLLKHVRNIHGSEPMEVFPCPFCSYETHLKHYLPVHIKRHTREKAFACEVCGWRCINKKSLTNHIKSQHPDHKQYSCHLCDYKAKVRKDVTNHVQDKHAAPEKGAGEKKARSKK